MSGRVKDIVAKLMTYWFWIKLYIGVYYDKSTYSFLQGVLNTFYVLKFYMEG